LACPKKRIKEDPLRIIRALRLALVLNFSIEKKSFVAIKKYFYLIDSLTINRIKKELNKVTNKKNNLLLQKLIKDKNLLDNKFK
jgi:tRNA nucleotidyltransferase (CCA-adding enzyme)